MKNQNLFNTICDLYDTPPTQDEMYQILRAVEEDKRQVVLENDKELNKVFEGEDTERSKQLPCKHEHIESSDGCDECMDCGVRNY